MHSLAIDQKTCFTQMPQTFAKLDMEEDFFDMRNEYGFRLSNTIRSGVGAVTSCGTNACWNLKLKNKIKSSECNIKDLPSGPDPPILPYGPITSGNLKKYNEKHQLTILDYRFNTDTMIEDTASSHDAVLEGRRSVYHFERLVVGARKGAADYLAAIFRWSKGAVQLFCLSYFNPLKFYKDGTDLMCCCFGSNKAQNLERFCLCYDKIDREIRIGFDCGCCICCDIMRRVCCRMLCCGGCQRCCGGYEGMYCASWSLNHEENTREIKCESASSSCNFLTSPCDKTDSEPRKCCRKFGTECGACCDACCTKCCTHACFPIVKSWWPWCFLIAYILPIIIVILSLQMIDVNRNVPKDWLGFDFCNGWLNKDGTGWRYKDEDNCTREHFVISSLVFNGPYVFYCAWMFSVALLSYFNRKIATYVILLENTTYFFNSASAFYWAFLPFYMTVTGSIPFHYDAAMLTFGGLWLEVCTYYLLSFVKAWAPKDKKKPPSEAAVMRAQQMYFMTAPLHIFAMVKGCASGYGVRCLKWDQSFWNSFENTDAMMYVNVWAVILLSSMVTSVLCGIVNLFVMGYKVELLIGIATSGLILSIVYEPIIAMFFHQKMVAYKQRNKNAKRTFKKCIAAIFGEGTELSPRYFNICFWFVLFIASIVSDTNGVFYQVWGLN